MPEQRRRGAGRQTTSIDRDYIDTDDLRARYEAERAADAADAAEAIDDPVLRGEEEPYALDHSYSRGGSAWPGSWGGA